MARNNLTWIKGDITGDIYYDNFHLDSKDVQYLRLYRMIKGVVGAAAVKGVRECVYGPLAELVYGHVRKGSRSSPTPTKSTSDPVLSSKNCPSLSSNFLSLVNEDRFDIL